MTETRTYPAGVPCWVDSQQPDLDEAIRFYGGLFGWTFEDAMPPDVDGHYLIAQLDGADVGAIAPTSMGAPTAGWNTYIAVDDADGVAIQIAASGGEVASPPQDAGPAGRAAWFLDPSRAPLRIWQPGRRAGSQAVNMPGAWNFSNLRTSDAAVAQAFYARVFGWEIEDVGGATLWRLPGYGDHLASTVDPDIHARQAAIAAPPGFADGVAWLEPLTEGDEPHWQVTFAVADRDESVSLALNLGATLASPVADTAWTRTAELVDPQGAAFTISQFTPGA